MAFEYIEKGWLVPVVATYRNGYSLCGDEILHCQRGSNQILAIFIPAED